MSEERVELVRQGFEAWNAGDRGWVLDHMAEDVEWITPGEDPEPGHYRGRAELVEFWDQWRAAVGQLRFDLEDLIDAGSDVVVIARRSGTGEHSGISVSDRIVQVFSFDGDTCVRVQEFYDRRAALEAAGEGSAGVSEPGPAGEGQPSGGRFPERATRSEEDSPRWRTPR